MNLQVHRNLCSAMIYVIICNIYGTSDRDQNAGCPLTWGNRFANGQVKSKAHVPLASYGKWTSRWLCCFQMQHVKCQPDKWLQKNTKMYFNSWTENLSNCVNIMFFSGSSTTEDRSTEHPKFNLTGVRTHDLQVMDSTFHVPETLALTTEPSGTIDHVKGYAFIAISWIISLLGITQIDLEV